MKTMKFLTYTIFVLFLGFAISSCSSEDGTTGPAGADGTDGQDGQDGNANVQTYIFNNPTWSGVSMELVVPAITQEVLDNDQVLGYWLGNDWWTSTNGPYLYGILSDTQFLGHFAIVAHEFDGSLDNTPPTLEKVKILIIKSSNTTSTNGNGKSSIYSELEMAGVDITNYYDVCDYYGLDPE